MATETDQARLIAERIARRVAGNPPPRSRNQSPANSELAEIRSVLTDLQRKLDQVESKIGGEAQQEVEETPRARFHNFVGGPNATGTSPIEPPTARRSSEQKPAARTSNQSVDKFSEFTPPTHSPWLSGVYIPATHASEERFGVEEATVSELVEFFENEKKCSMEPGEKPCDHCAMCSSRGF